MNLSQEKFAQTAGISRGTISQIELGNQKPTLEIIDSIAKYFNIPFEYFFSEMSPSQAIENNKGYTINIPPSVIEENQQAYSCKSCKQKDEQIENLTELIAYLKQDISNLRKAHSAGQKRKVG